EVAAQGWPSPANNPTAFDVLVYAKQDWKFDDLDRKHAGSGSPTSMDESQTGAHGYPNTRPLMKSIFIASGADIRRAGEQPPCSVLDVAPTIATILHLSQSGMDGHPLTAILK
ncbi:MAG: alkaline phosphatase family protein, partial [Terriglobus roseus]|nr:alkaline phosphatase family protein [Terriglobus roseus]